MPVTKLELTVIANLEIIIRLENDKGLKGVCKYALEKMKLPASQKSLVKRYIECRNEVWSDWTKLLEKDIEKEKLDKLSKVPEL